MKTSKNVVFPFKSLKNN